MTWKPYRSVRRRTVLQVAAFWAAAGMLGLASVRPTQAAEAVTRTAMESRLIDLFSRPDSAARIGRSYLRATPDEADRGKLLAAILDAEPKLGSPRRRDSRELRRLIAAQCRREFASGRTAQVDGWIIARTEARLCALAALETDPTVA